MKVYYNLGNEEFNKEEFAYHLLINRLALKIGTITSSKILERKFMSNKGHAVSGTVDWEDCLSSGFNIGRNPIGTGYLNYIPFLEEMECQKIGGIYRLSSLIGKNLIALDTGTGSNGVITSKGFLEIAG